MIQSHAGFKKRDYFKQELEEEANFILRADRRSPFQCPAQIDLLSKRDAERRDRRRRELARRNFVLMENYLSPTTTRSSEEHLIARQDQAQKASSIFEILQRFKKDKAVQAVMTTAILGDISFFSTRELAAACRLREDVVRAAKERIKYFARTHG
ncbi:MAG: hypothetical protein ABJ251_16265 [Paracoccaceae bacterium]